MARKFRMSFSYYDSFQEISEHVLCNWEVFYDSKPTRAMVEKDVIDGYFPWGMDIEWECFLNALGKEFLRRYQTRCIKLEKHDLDNWCNDGSDFFEIKANTSLEAGKELFDHFNAKGRFATEVTLDSGRLLVKISRYCHSKGCYFLLKPCAYTTYEREMQHHD